MKKLLQLFLLFILILLIIFFYKTYFNDVELKNKETQNPKDLYNTTEDNKINKSNIIKNLKYEISVKERNDYILNSELSEITYNKDGQELILMSNVNAVIIDSKNKIIISSDKAEYNNYNNHTKFMKNVKIEFDNNKILANEVMIDFNKNIFLISDNIRYSSPTGTIEADYMSLNLITKKFDVFMNNENDNVMIKFNR